MLLMLVVISSIFFPKINLIPLSEATYIRVDDLLIALYLFSRWSTVYLTVRELRGISWYRSFKLFLLVSLISVFVNSLATGYVTLLSALLFALRHIEYFLYFFVGIEVFEAGFNISKTFKIYMYFLCVLIPAQSLGLVPAVSNFAVSRAIGNTAGPFELAAVAAVMFTFFAAEGERRARVLYSLIAFVVVVLTQSRITLFAMLVVWTIAHRSLIVRFFKKRILLALAVAIAITIANWLALNSNGLGDLSIFRRFISAFNTDPETLTTWLDGIPTISSQEDYFFYAYDQLLQGGMLPEGDASAFIRFFRWAILLNFSFSGWLSTLIGVGPSFASVAVDGYYVRLLCETGVLGLLFYLKFLRDIYRSYQEFEVVKNVVLVLAITGTFIDIFVSSKAMFLMWMLMGFYFRNFQKIKNDVKRSRLESDWGAKDAECHRAF